jgi:hypothetical protein
MDRCDRERIEELVVLTEPGGGRAAAEFTVEFTSLDPAGEREAMRRPPMTRRDGIGLLIVAASLAGLFLFRAAYVEPRAWGGACAAAAAPLVCVPRGALLWLQYEYLWGLGALALGVAAFLSRGFALCVASVVLGAAAVVNYNATWGMLGAALGAWTWIGHRDQARTPG